MITIFLISLVLLIDHASGAVPVIGIGVGEAYGLPQGFEKILPEGTLKELRALYRKREIALYDNFEELNMILTSLPKETLDQLPLPVELQILPEKLQAKIRKIQSKTSLSWKQRQFKIGRFIDSQPDSIKAMLGGMPPAGIPGMPPPNVEGQPDMGMGGMSPPAADDHQQADGGGSARVELPQPNGPPFPRGPNFPPSPPPEYAKFLPEENYDRLLSIHMDSNLSKEEKEAKIETVMRSLPQEVVGKLPLPADFDMLPDKYREQARQVILDPKIGLKDGQRKVFEFVLSLPPKYRKGIFPPVPPKTFEILPPQAKDQVVKMYGDKKLNEEKLAKKFWELVDQLPPQIKEQVTAALKDDSNSNPEKKKSNEEE